MRARRLILAALIALIALTAACGSSVTGEAAGDILHYSYRPGEALAYEVELAVEGTSRSNGGAFGTMDWTMEMDITERLELAFTEGDDPATIRITMTQQVIDGEARTSTMGQEQSIPLEQVTAGLMNQVEVVIDPSGKLLSMSIGGSELPAQLLAAISGLSGSTMLQPQQLGPEFPEDPLTVGDEWQSEGGGEVLGMEMTQTSRHRIVAEEDVLGRRTYRIESRITTGPIMADLAGLIAALQEAPGLFGEGDAAQIEASIGQFDSLGIDLEFELAESTAVLTTWFDPAAGIVVRSHLEAPTTVIIRTAGLPGEGDGTMTVEMATDQRMTLAP